jgi:hypothetical protein
MKDLLKIYNKHYLMRAPKGIKVVCHNCRYIFQNGDEIFCDWLRIEDVNDYFVNNVCRKCIIKLRSLEK